MKLKEVREQRRLEPYGPVSRMEKPRFHRPAIQFALTNPAPQAVLPRQRYGRSILGRVAVGRAVQEDYEKRLLAFRVFTKENTLCLESDEDVEEALVLYMTEAFMEGRPSDHGRKMFAAFQWQNPQYGRFGGRALPRVRMALQGWAKGSPPRHRLPMAWNEACAIAAELLRERQWEHAVCMLLMFDLYLRPGEAFSLTVGSAAPPVAEGERSTQNWAFSVRPYAEGIPAKAGAFDDGVVLDHPKRLFLGPLVGALRAKRPAHAKLFATVDARCFGKSFRVAIARLRLDLVLYQARHGGASADRAEGFRPLEEVRKRGRWRSEAGTRRYERHGKLQAKLAALPASMRAYMYHISLNIEKIMRLEMQVPPPPRDVNLVALAPRGPCQRGLLAGETRRDRATRAAG